jgi:hypothetical protein
MAQANSSSCSSKSAVPGVWTIFMVVGRRFDVSTIVKRRFNARDDETVMTSVLNLATKNSAAMR